MGHLAFLVRRPLARALLGLAVLSACALAVVKLALRERLPPDRCPAGMQLAGQRCCGARQRQERGACAGAASSCATPQLLRDGQCVAVGGAAALPGGELFVGAADWDGARDGERERFPRTLVKAFRLDIAEVTLERWSACTSCPSRPGPPGMPVTDVTAEQAEAFCRSQRGRLPTASEWVFAAAGAEARRYPWGSSGLVCRRAAFGLEHGPCATLGAPELVGSRPDGASPEGVHDLAGNVAEWTREPGGGYTARGGSYRSQAAAELKTWSALPNPGARPYIGFRCAYPP
jgi:formylglycine-generating enzyme